MIREFYGNFVSCNFFQNTRFLLFSSLIRLKERLENIHFRVKLLSQQKFKSHLRDKGSALLMSLSIFMTCSVNETFYVEGVQEFEQFLLCSWSVHSSLSLSVSTLFSLNSFCNKQTTFKSQDKSLSSHTHTLSASGEPSTSNVCLFLVWLTGQENNNISWQKFVTCTAVLSVILLFDTTCVINFVDNT